MGFGEIVVNFKTVHRGNDGQDSGLPKGDGMRKSMPVCMLAVMFRLDLRSPQT